MATIEGVLDHVATQHTQHERSRYWMEQAFEREAPVLAPAPAAPFVKQPPADTPVLLGFVKSEAHRQWIIEQKLYNVRADGRRGTVEERSPGLSGRSSGRELGTRVVEWLDRELQHQPSDLVLQRLFFGRAHSQSQDLGDPFACGLGIEMRFAIPHNSRV